jgi:hypothetical protein
MEHPRRSGTALIFFGVGVLVAFCLPAWFLILSLCALVIYAGLCCRSR